jgi:hypothetical protein
MRSVTPGSGSRFRLYQPGRESRRSCSLMSRPTQGSKSRSSPQRARRNSTRKAWSSRATRSPASTIPLFYLRPGSSTTAIRPVSSWHFARRNDELRSGDIPERWPRRRAPRLSDDPTVATEESVRAIRALDESSLARSYWHFYWEDERSHWYHETVNDDGEEWSVKQLVLEADGSIPQILVAANR